MRVFVVSDWDQSGVHLFSALAEDVTAFAAVDAPGTEVVFERLAVTEQQIADYGLPTAPPKASDHRSFSGTSTTQAEALPPDVLAAMLKAAIDALCRRTRERPHPRTDEKGQLLMQRGLLLGTLLLGR